MTGLVVALSRMYMCIINQAMPSLAMGHIYVAHMGQPKCEFIITIICQMSPVSANVKPVY